MLVVDPIARFSGADTSDLLARDGSTPNQHGELALSSVLADTLLDNGFGQTS
jgi:hypothetical protein